MEFNNNEDFSRVSILLDSMQKQKTNRSAIDRRLKVQLFNARDNAQDRL